MSNRHCLTRFKTISWLLPYTPVLLNIKDGAYLTCCSQDTKPRYANGNSNNHSSVPSVYAPIYWRINNPSIPITTSAQSYYKIVFDNNI